MLTEDHRKRIVRAGQQCELALAERDHANRQRDPIYAENAKHLAEFWSRVAFFWAAHP